MAMVRDGDGDGEGMGCWEGKEFVWLGVFIGMGCRRVSIHFLNESRGVWSTLTLTLDFLPLPCWHRNKLFSIKRLS